MPSSILVRSIAMHFKHRSGVKERVSKKDVSSISHTFSSEMAVVISLSNAETLFPTTYRQFYFNILMQAHASSAETTTPYPFLDFGHTPGCRHSWDLEAGTLHQHLCGMFTPTQKSSELLDKTTTRYFNSLNSIYGYRFHSRYTNCL